MYKQYPLVSSSFILMRLSSTSLSAADGELKETPFLSLGNPSEFSGSGRQATTIVSGWEHSGMAGMVGCRKIGRVEGPVFRARSLSPVDWKGEGGGDWRWSHP